MVLRIVRTINCWRRWADYNLADQDLTGEYYTGEQRESGEQREMHEMRMNTSETLHIPKSGMRGLLELHLKQ